MEIAAGLAAGVFFEVAGFFADVDELFDRFLREVIGTAEGFREDGDLCGVLEGFEAVESLPEVVTIGDCTMKQ